MKYSLLYLCLTPVNKTQQEGFTILDIMAHVVMVGIFMISISTLFTPTTTGNSGESNSRAALVLYLR
ncbi:MAG: hypothetical protein WBB28_15065 [Crinalium sp.]